MDFEIKIIEFLQSGRNTFFDVTFQVLSQIGSVLGVIAVCVLFLCFKYKLSFWYLFTYGFVNLIVQIVKSVVERVRPFNVTDTIISIGDAVHDYSFPSGHAASATAIAIFLGYFLFQYFKGKGARVGIVISLVLYVGLVCLSRMYLGKHYLTDLIAGVVISALICVLGIWFMKFCQRHRKRRLIKEKMRGKMHEN